MRRCVDVDSVLDIAALRLFVNKSTIEISKLDFIIMQKYVARAQISMQNTLFLEFYKALQNLASVHDDLVLGKNVSVVIDSLIESSIIAKFENETGILDSNLFLPCHKFVKQLLIFFFLWIFIDQLNHLNNSMGFVHDLVA